jgi:hypothetical protein
VEIDARWAGAWVRVLRGDPPWPKPRVPRPEGEPRASTATPPPATAKGSRAWALGVLGLEPAVTSVEIKRAFRSIALRTHPDRGGDQAAFVEARRAYDVALAAAESPRRRRRTR